MDLNRRDFLKGGAIFGSGAALMGLAGCGKQPTPSGDTPAKEYPNGVTEAFLKDSLVEVDPITSFIEEAEFDIVVVGAGTAGVPAVLTAVEEGATVACLQKQNTAQGNGNGSGAIILEESNELGIQCYKHGWAKEGGFRYNDDLLELFMRHSGETCMWLLDRSKKAGFPDFKLTNMPQTYEDGKGKCAYFMKSIGKPKNHGSLMQELAKVAESKGAKFYYSTPAVQLVKADDGSITGVIGKSEQGYVKLTAKKAVIIAAGDYQNNEAMVETYSPDVTRFNRKQERRTGDGHLMTMLAGGVMCPVGHAKTMHDMDSSPLQLTQLPFMAVDETGKRFMSEDIPMQYWDTRLHDRPASVEDPGRFYRIFDDAYETKYNAPAPAKKGPLANYMRDKNGKPIKDEPSGVFVDLIDTFRCDTLDELANAVGLPAAQLKKTVDEWNKMCEEGDSLFGNPSSIMHPIDTPPYYCTRTWIRCSAINTGVAINGNCQVLDADGNVIKGLYSVGSGAGDICGDHEWNLSGGGLCCGSYHTMGRYAALHAVNGKLASKNPMTYQAAKGLLGRE